MKIATLNFLPIAMVVMLLCGCASTGGRDVPKSEALQIAQAAGMKNIRDVSRADYDKAVRERPDVAGSTAVEAIAVGTGVFNPAKGWSVGGQTAFLGVMTLLTALPTYVPEKDHRFLIWMPVGEASNPEAAAVHMRETIEESFREALPEYQVALKKRYFGGSGAGERWYLAVDGPKCDSCEMYSLTFFNHIPDPKRRKAPTFLGGHDAYVWSVDGWRNSNFSGFPGDSAGKESLSASDRMNILTKVSGALPSWVYIYVAPKDDFTGFPLILYQGNPLFFVEPVS